MTTFSKTRRVVLASLAGGAAAALAPTALLQAMTPACRASLEAPLHGVFTCLQSAAAVGEAYLSGHPQEADATLLAGALAPGGDVRHQVRADFAAGRVVRVDGWLLALTEARLCALAALA